MIRSLLLQLLGRRNTWRLGRSLYLAARRELNNAIQENGEATLIRRAIAAHRASSAHRVFRAFDIGANLGEWTAEVARFADGGIDWTVDLFEPVDGSFAHVSALFADEPRIQCHKAAVSSDVGSAQMVVVGETSGTNHLSAHAAADVRTITVPLTTIAAQMEARDIDRIDLIKIDTEGHDIEILRGLRALLDRRAIGVVQFEYNWRWLPNKGSLYEVFQLIRDTGYRLARVCPDGLAIFPEWNAELDRYFEANYALIAPDMADAIGAVQLRWEPSNVAVSA